MPILLCLLLILSLEVQAAPATSGTGIDARVQSLRMDRLEHVAALKVSRQEDSARTELEDLYTRFRNDRIDSGALTRLVRQLILTGLPQGANKVLNAPVGKRLAVETREALWLELAAAWCQRDYPAEAGVALSRVAPLRRGAQIDRLRAQVAMQDGHREEAVTLLESLDRLGQATALDKYNLATLSLAAASQTRNKAAVRLLSDLIKSKSTDAAIKNLAAVTLGRTLIDSGDFQTAIRILKQVDNNSIRAPEAHYMLGKAYMAVDQPRKAIGLWDELAHRPPTDPFTERAMMALPPALGALDATGEAVTRIAAIQRQLEQAITDLSTALNELAAQNWIERITLISAQDPLSARDVHQIPAAPYVLDQISSNRFQVTVTNAQVLRDLKNDGLSDDLERRRQALLTAQTTYITNMIRAIVEIRLGMLEHDLLDTRFEYALLLDNQAGDKK